MNPMSEQIHTHVCTKTLLCKLTVTHPCTHTYTHRPPKIHTCSLTYIPLQRRHLGTQTRRDTHSDKSINTQRSRHTLLGAHTQTFTHMPRSCQHRHKSASSINQTVPLGGCWSQPQTPLTCPQRRRALPQGFRARCSPENDRRK